VSTPKRRRARPAPPAPQPSPAPPAPPAQQARPASQAPPAPKAAPRALPPRLPERRSRARRARDAAIAGMVALLGFAIGLFVFNSVIMPRLIHGRPEVLVPDLSNLSVEQAAA